MIIIIEDISKNNKIETYERNIFKHILLMRINPLFSMLKIKKKKLCLSNYNNIFMYLKFTSVNKCSQF